MGNAVRALGLRPTETRDEATDCGAVSVIGLTVGAFEVGFLDEANLELDGEHQHGVGRDGESGG